MSKYVEANSARVFGVYMINNPPSGRPVQVKGQRPVALETANIPGSGDMYLPRNNTGFSTNNSAFFGPASAVQYQREYAEQSGQGLGKVLKETGKYLKKSRIISKAAPVVGEIAKIAGFEEAGNIIKKSGKVAKQVGLGELPNGQLKQYKAPVEKDKPVVVPKPKPLKGNKLKK